MDRFPQNLKEDENKHLVLFVGGLSSSTTEENLFRHFSLFGKIAKVKVARHSNTKQSKGFGYLVIRDPISMQNILQSVHIVGGRRVDVQVASRAPRSKSNEQALLQRKVFTTNLPQGLSEAEFFEIFSAFGEIRNGYIKAVKEKRHIRSFGFLEFVERECAQGLVNKRIMIKGVPVTCLAYKKQNDLKRNYRKEHILPIFEESSEKEPATMVGIDNEDEIRMVWLQKTEPFTERNTRIQSVGSLDRKVIADCMLDDGAGNYRFNVAPKQPRSRRANVGTQTAGDSGVLGA